MRRLSFQTSQKNELIDITAQVKKIVRDGGIPRGACTVFVPHTTAAVTMNENTDAHVRQDILRVLDRMAPLQDDYGHAEGNAAAHIKAAIVGPSVTVFVENGHLVLGTWQSIYLCEFDGPRSRSVLVKVIPG